MTDSNDPTSSTAGTAAASRRQYRRRIASPRLEIIVTQEHIDRAKKADSRGCMVAEAINDRYPHYLRVEVDFHSIRLTDPAKNIRFSYINPRTVAEALLKFDQGVPVEPFTCKTVHASHIIRNGPATRRKRLASTQSPQGSALDASVEAEGTAQSPPASETSVEAKAAATNRIYMQRRRASRIEPTGDGEALPPAEYVKDLVKRVDDPEANLGPPVAVWPVSHATIDSISRPTMVGGKLPRRPGQFQTTRRFGAREFWPGDGSGVTGTLKRGDNEMPPAASD